MKRAGVASPTERQTPWSPRLALTDGRRLAGACFPPASSVELMERPVDVGEFLKRIFRCYDEAKRIKWLDNPADRINAAARAALLARAIDEVKPRR
jgi:hypothetical protein